MYAVTQGPQGTYTIVNEEDVTQPGNFTVMIAGDVLEDVDATLPAAQAGDPVIADLVLDQPLATLPVNKDVLVRIDKLIEPGEGDDLLIGDGGGGAGGGAGGVGPGTGIDNKGIEVIDASLETACFCPELLDGWEVKCGTICQRPRS